jgi:hypothetical protein
MDARLAVARTLLLDHVAVEVADALADGGVRAILLKGAALAGWLYQDTPRPYTDVDLLVAADRFTTAEGVLARLGFALGRPGLSPREETPHARVWQRAGVAVDLHRTLWGVGVEPSVAWALLTQETEQLPLRTASLDVLGLPARALHVALHAAQDGVWPSKAREDLSRAVSQVPLDTWRRAAQLAGRLRADAAMAAGLRLDPQGAQLADDLGLPRRAPLGVALRVGSTSGDGRSLSRLAAERGLRNKVALSARLMVPSPALLRAKYPFAAQDPVALALVYLLRPLRLASRLPGAVLSVARAVAVRGPAPMSPPGP